MVGSEFTCRLVVIEWMTPAPSTNYMVSILYHGFCLPVNVSIVDDVLLLRNRLFLEQMQACFNTGTSRLLLFNTRR